MKNLHDCPRLAASHCGEACLAVNLSTGFAAMPPKQWHSHKNQGKATGEASLAAMLCGKPLGVFNELFYLTFTTPETTWPSAAKRGKPRERGWQRRALNNDVFATIIRTD